MEVHADLKLDLESSTASIYATGRVIEMLFADRKTFFRFTRSVAFMRSRKPVLKFLAKEGMSIRFHVADHILMEGGSLAASSGWYLGGKMWRVWPLNLFRAVRSRP